MSTVTCVDEGEIAPGQALPRVFRATEEATDLASWVGAHRERVDGALRGHGALLFRGFAPPSASGFKAFCAAASTELLDYVYRSTPRTSVEDKVYTATEYPAHMTIPQHCENAYQRRWPTRLMFCCLQAAAKGGATPLTDVFGVTKRLDPKLVERFATRRVMYVRNYHVGLDLPWQTVFQTDDKRAVESYCRAHAIELEWRARGALRTRQVAQGVAIHPEHRRTVWFNQAHLFHVSALEPRTRDGLLGLYAEDELPRNAYYGDGRAIEPGVLEEIRAAHSAETVSYPWRTGDALLVDNMRVAHGRAPYEGPRRVLVAMADPSATPESPA
jgi:alpha-ketoglutarate-dependent taurine dioxygenase